MGTAWLGVMCVYLLRNPDPPSSNIRSGDCQGIWGLMLGILLLFFKHSQEFGLGIVGKRRGFGTVEAPRSRA